MPWVKLTDDWYDDPDIVAAGPLGLAMWVVGLSWCARNLTDGHIPSSQIRKLLDLQDITVGSENVRADDIAAQLVELGRWTRTPTGYVVENYHRYQPTREKVLADRERDRERKASSRRSERPDGLPPDTPGSPERPVPVPTELSVLSSSGDSREPGEPVDDEIPAATWKRYAELKLERQRPGSVNNETSWKRTAARNARTEHLEQAQAWWRAFDISPERLAECLIDGRPPAVMYRRKDSA